MFSLEKFGRGLKRKGWKVSSQNDMLHIMKKDGLLNRVQTSITVGVCSGRDTLYLDSFNIVIQDTEQFEITDKAFTYLFGVYTGLPMHDSLEMLISFLLGLSDRLVCQVYHLVRLYDKYINEPWAKSGGFRSSQTNISAYGSLMGYRLECIESGVHGFHRCYCDISVGLAENYLKYYITPDSKYICPVIKRGEKYVNPTDEDDVYEIKTKKELLTLVKNI